MTSQFRIDPDDNARLLSSTDVSRLTGVSRMTLWRWIEHGVLPPPQKIRGRNYWQRGALLEAIQNAGRDAA